jgi:hypothetical protein
MSRRVLAAVILLMWAGGLAWMVKREYLRPTSELLADATLRIPPGATYFSLELGGQQVGYASNKIDTLTDTILVQDVMLLEIPALGTIQRVEARTEAVLSRTLRLRGFEAVLRGDEMQFGAVGVVSGDTLLTVDLETAESRRTLEVPLEQGIVLPAMLPLHLVFGSEPAVGNTYAFRMFDPLLLAERTVDVTITAESTLVFPDSAAFDSTTGLWVPARWDTLRAWRIAQDIGGISLDAWIDELGQVIEAASPVGFRMERTAFEIAFENFQRGGASAAQLTEGLGDDVIRQTAIASNVRLETGDLQELRVRLGGVDLDAYALSGGRQRLAGDTLIVQREGAAVLTRDPQRFAPERTRELGRYVREEPLVQSRDPRIQALARQVAGRRRDPVRVAELLNEWVYENLEKRVMVTVPSALDVLDARRGDCNEHTVLYVALARAAGIPARTAAGLVYVDGRFYYHAWPEVYLSDWVAVDPTFGQFPADASHLRFTIGGLARQVELIRLIGRLQLDVVSAEDGAT